MHRSRIDEREFKIIAEQEGLEFEDVRRIVNSYFTEIFYDARKLPFNNIKKIFTKNKFFEYSKVRNIPYIGRIGPSYSRYLSWRRNEASQVEMLSKKYGKKRSEIDAEGIAADILGRRKAVSDNGELERKQFDKVWIYGQSGRKQAAQIIKKDTDV